MCDARSLRVLSICCGYEKVDWESWLFFQREIMCCRKESWAKIPWR